MSSNVEAVRDQLNAAELIKQAQDQTGLTEFGTDEFLEPMNKLFDSIATEANFHQPGIEGFKMDVVRCLVNRLRMQEDITNHPEILLEDVSDPIIIIGLGRSGTTKLHKMFSAPDSVQTTLFWRLWFPGRFPDALEGKPDPRIAAADFAHLLSDDNPDMDAAHHIEPTEVEEEWLLYFHTFEDWAWNQQFYIPSFFDWTLERDRNVPYQYVKTMLQYLQWQDGGKQGRPWILKTVGYLLDMDALMKCYPNATLVHPHRDPRSTIPSYAKLLSSVWPMVSEVDDPSLVGKDVLRTWEIAMGRYLEARERLQLDKQIIDVDYEVVRSDPMSIMRAAYEKAGLVMMPEAEKSMQDWHAGNEQGKYGKHSYSLEMFGLNEEMIDEAFAEYIKRFIKR